MMTMKTSLMVLGGLALAAVSAFGFAAATAERADCPGKIVCPLSGELTCRDECPTIDSTRADCPGRIECPLTGELVCVDRCPVAPSEATKDVPSCCRNK